jgi:hypothetical protein
MKTNESSTVRNPEGGAKHEAKISPGVVFRLANASSLDNFSGDSIRIVASPLSREQEREPLCASTAWSCHTDVALRSTG